MAERTIPGAAAACLGAVLLLMPAASHAQQEPQPTPEQIEAAHDRLRQGLGATAYPPAAYEDDPVPEWAVPGHEPLVLGGEEAEDPLAPRRATAEDDETDGGTTPVETETVTAAPEPAAPADIEQSAPEEKPPAKTATPTKKTPAKKKTVAKPRAPQVKTGRASADKDRAAAKPKAAPKSPPRPRIELPERLRP